MLRILLALAGAGFIWAGGQGVYTAMVNREPTRLTCRDYSLDALRGAWLELQDCELSLLEAAYEERNGKITQLYLPLRSPVRAEDDERIDIVLATREPESPELFSLARQLLAIEDEQTFTQFAIDHHDQVFRVGSFRGLLRYGVDLDEDDQRDLRSLDENLSQDFIIITRGLRPQTGQSFVLLSIGLALLAAVLLPLLLRARPAPRRGFAQRGLAKPK